MKTKAFKHFCEMELCQMPILWSKRSGFWIRSLSRIDQQVHPGPQKLSQLVRIELLNPNCFGFDKTAYFSNNNNPFCLNILTGSIQNLFPALLHGIGSNITLTMGSPKRSLEDCLNILLDLPLLRPATKVPNVSYSHHIPHSQSSNDQIPIATVCLYLITIAPLNLLLVFYCSSYTGLLICDWVLPWPRLYL